MVHIVQIYFVIDCFNIILNKDYNYEYIYSNIINIKKTLFLKLWFNDNYAKVTDIKEETNITIRDLYGDNRNTNYYKLLTKTEKRKLTQRVLLDFFKNDIMLKDHIFMPLILI